MNSKNIFVVILLTLLLMFGCTGNSADSSAADTPDSYSSVPAAVTSSYNSLVEKYKDLVGAGLTVCSKGTDIVYVTTGSAGDRAENYYYDSQGNLLDEFMLTADNLEAVPPIDLSAYDCAISRQVSGPLDVPAE